MSDQDKDEVAVRGWLASVDVPPPRLAVEDLVHLGRRKVRRRHLAASGMSLVLLAAAAMVPVTGQWLELWGGGIDPLAAPVVGCAATELPLPAELVQSGNLDVRVSGIDPTGRWVVGNETVEEADTPTTMVLWEDGQPAVIPPPDGFEFAFAAAVNADGVVAGIAGNESFSAIRPDTTSFRAWTYHDGEFTILAAPAGGAVGWTAGINGAGDVVGLESPPTGGVAVWWAGAADQPQLVELPAHTGLHTAVIGDDGTIAVTVFIDGTRQPHLWDAERGMRQLPLPAGVTDAVVEAVSGSWAVGTGDVHRLATEIKPLPAGAPPVLAEIAPDPDFAERVEEGTRVSLTAPVRWDLRDGGAEIVTSGDLSRYGLYSSGIAVTNTGQVMVAAQFDRLLFRDGRWHELPIPFEYAGLLDFHPVSDGTTVAGTVSHHPSALGEPAAFTRAVLWRC